MLVLSREFYQSPVCLAEMGAIWGLSKDHVPILVLPLTYEELKGDVPLSQGMLVIKQFKYNKLANLVELLFALPAHSRDWECSRANILSRIEAHLATAAEVRRASVEVERREQLQLWEELAAIMANTKGELGWLPEVPPPANEPLAPNS